jgi:methylated-DNA-[protein]-cysteine S-methyltransferase
MRLRGSTTETPLGVFGLVSHGGSLVAAGFTGDYDELLLPSWHDGIDEVELLEGITDRVAAYFDGDVKALDSVSTAPEGSDRKKAAWEAMRKVPPGPLSYAGLAQRMPPPASARSAARACATNPIALIVPCHRFIGSDGKMHGYYWGIDRKEWLLKHEQKFMS